MNRMSPIFKSYLAGQMRALPEILPFFAPTVNSYKRLVEGYWAPTSPGEGTRLSRPMASFRSRGHIHSRYSGAMPR